MRLRKQRGELRRHPQQLDEDKLLKQAEIITEAGIIIDELQQEAALYLSF